MSVEHWINRTFIVIRADLIILVQCVCVCVWLIYQTTTDKTCNKIRTKQCIVHNILSFMQITSELIKHREVWCIHIIFLNSFQTLKSTSTFYIKVYINIIVKIISGYISDNKII